jgi:hypothetical protein
LAGRCHQQPGTSQRGNGLYEKGIVGMAFGCSLLAFPELGWIIGAGNARPLGTQFQLATAVGAVAGHHLQIQMFLLGDAFLEKGMSALGPARKGCP